MNKRYIDFVPAKKNIPKGGIAKTKSTKVAKPVKKIVKKIPAANPLLDEEIRVEEIFAEKEEPKGVSKGAPKMGVIEDYQKKFVKTDVKKRPLSAKKPVSKPVKPAPVAKAPVVKAPVVKPAPVKPATPVKPAPVKKPAPAKNPAPLGQRTKFINTNKIEKRPLSKSTAPKKPVVIPKMEKPKAPEKIISKPEKDSKAGLIIAIILTIILGAAAGTVAFLLLPK